MNSRSVQTWTYLLAFMAMVLGAATVATAWPQALVQSGPLPDGRYVIHAKGISPPRCLDIRQAPLRHENDKVGYLQIWDCTPENTWQHFDLTYDPTVDAYKMRIEKEKSGNTNDCLDVYGNSHDDGTILQAFRCNDQSNQRFRLVPEGSWYQIRPMHVGNKCLDIANESVGNAAEVHQWPCGTNKNNQLWGFELISAAPSLSPVDPCVSPENLYGDSDTCIPTSNYYRCQLIVHNRSNRLIEADMHWRNAGIPPTTFTYDVPKMTVPARRDQVDGTLVVESFRPMARNNPKDDFFATNPHCK